MDLPKFLLSDTPWERQNSIWLASSFELFRNYSRYKFPSKMDENEKKSLLLLQKKVVLEIGALHQPVWLEGSTLSVLDREFLFERFLCLEIPQIPSSEEVFVVDTSGEVLLTLHTNDHIHLRFIDYSQKWEKGFERLSEIETAIGKEIDYAFSSKFGYLTADPFQCGTALKAEVYLHLPALIHMRQLETALVKEKEEEVIAMGMKGNLEEMIGDVLVLENYYTLGVNEDTILRALHISASKLVGLEKALRLPIKEQKFPEIMDSISRAFGLLRHSYQLETKEVLDALSLVMLGIDLGWVGGISEAKIRELFFKCRKGHLVTALGKKTMEPAEIAKQRAHYLHGELSNMKLLIES